MLPNTRKLFKWLMQPSAHKYAWTWSRRPTAIVGNIPINGPNQRLEIALTAEGTFVVRSIIPERSFESICDQGDATGPKGLAAHQFRKDKELVKQLYRYASDVAGREYDWTVVNLAGE